MIVRVRLFAVAREIAGTQCVEMDLAEGATAEDVTKALAQRVPALESVVRHSILAVDGEPAAAESVVPADAEVALIPPVSGG